MPTLPLSLVFHLDDLTPAELDEARAHADGHLLGIDPDTGLDPEWSSWADAPLAAVVAHLLMFDPSWLFARRWCAGWVAEPLPDEPEAAEPEAELVAALDRATGGLVHAPTRDGGALCGIVVDFLAVDYGGAGVTCPACRAA